MRSPRDGQALEPRPGARQHRCGQIHSCEATTRTREWNQQPPCSTTQFEMPASGGTLEHEPLPEEEIAPAHRARVFPVIERRVVIPAHWGATSKRAEGKGQRAKVWNELTR